MSLVSSASLDAPEPAEVPGAGDVRLRALRWRPTGEPRGRFLLVHGLASNAMLWGGVARELARRGHESVAVDLRGHGRSDRPETGYDFATVTGDLIAAIAALGWERPVAVGQSWGGNLVVELAARAPDAVAGVAAVDGGTIELSRHYPRWEDCARELRPPALAGMPAADLETRIRAAHPDWPEEGVAATMNNFETLPDGTIRPWLTLDRHMAILRALWEHRPEERFPGMRSPVLLIPARSEGDDAGWASERRAATARAVAALPRGRAVAIDGDHDLHAQHPERIAALLDEAWSEGFFS